MLHALYSQLSIRPADMSGGCLVFVSPSASCQTTSQRDTTAPYHIPSNSQFTNPPTVWRCVVWPGDTGKNINHLL